MSTDKGRMHSGHSSAFNLAQLTIEAIHDEDVSVAAYAREHTLPYITLQHLLKTGIPPRRKAILDDLRTALGCTQDVFDSACAASKSNPTPAERPSNQVEPGTPLQAALQQLVAQRKMTVKAFADAADLSVLTATRLLKRGELPGRATTHEKLRSLLGITRGEYDTMLAQSRQVVADRAIVVDTTTATAVSNVSAAGQSAFNANLSDSELGDLLERLNPRQREALKAFILTLI